MKSRSVKIIALSIVGILVLIVALAFGAYFIGTTGAVDNEGYYLFCYFVGNNPDEETIHFAISSDGYKYTALNDNKPIIEQTMGTLSVRDPYIFKGQIPVEIDPNDPLEVTGDSNKYYIIGTDMKSEAGWNSNHSMVIWESTDLISWDNERIIDMTAYEATASADRVWAPQVYFDTSVNKYMVYWSNHNSTGSDSTTTIWYSYTTDFENFTNPTKLFAPKSGKDAIDADIIEKDGTYYLYYKDEEKSDICYVTSNSLTGPYTEPEDNVISITTRGVEGNTIYKLAGTDTYVLIMDMYSDGRFMMEQTTDLTNFKRVRIFDYSLDFSQRHGSVLSISKAEYDLLNSAKWN